MYFFIVTPSYNQDKFITQTIASVAKQRGDLKVVHWVFDAASSDKTVEILKKNKEKIKWESKKDRGQTHAINKGIKKLKGFIKKNKLSSREVIFAYINSDDFYLDSSFSSVLSSFKENKDKNWLVGDCVIVNEDSKEIQGFVRLYKSLQRKILSWNILGISNPIPQPATFIRASALLETGVFKEKLKYVMDYEYWLRTWKKQGSPILINKPLAAFRIHSESKGGTAYRKQFLEQYNVSRKFFKNPVILGLQKLHNFLIKLFYKILKD